MEQYERDIVYLSLCEEWSDKKIGIRLNTSRSKVQRIKQQTKMEIYNVMTGENSNEKIDLIYKIIYDAIKEDVDAEDTIFDYFEPYIIKLSKKPMLNEKG